MVHAPAVATTDTRAEVVARLRQLLGGRAIAIAAGIWGPIQPAFTGGTETLVYCLAAELAKLGIPVVLFASSDTPLPAIAGLTLVPTCLSTFALEQQARAAGHPVPGEGARTPEVMLHVRRVERWFRAHPGEVAMLHGHDLLSLADVPVPRLVTNHACLTAPMLQLAREMGVPCYTVARHAYQRWADAEPGALAGHVHNGVVLPERVKTARDRSLDPALRILSLARVCPEKGTHLVLRAAELIAARAIPVSVRLVGQEMIWSPGYFATAIRPYLDRHPTFQFVGPIYDAAARDAAHAWADVLAIASNPGPDGTWHENLALTPLEAWAIGTPAALSSDPGLTELLRPGVNGHAASLDTLATHGEEAFASELADAILRASTLRAPHPIRATTRSVTDMAHDYITHCYLPLLTETP